MKTAVSTLTIDRPRSLASALRALHDSLPSERLTPIAGGTDLFVYLNAGTHAGTRFLDLSTLTELRGVRAMKNGALRIGALATFRELGAHAAVRSRWPSLAAAAGVVGAAQIQARATLGGNIANASPAGDSLPVLLAHDAIVHAVSVRGERAVAFADLYTGYRRLALELTSWSPPSSSRRRLRERRRCSARSGRGRRRASRRSCSRARCVSRAAA